MNRDDTTTPHTIAAFDATLARDIANRERDANASQRLRDARRADYDAAMTYTPIARLLRERAPTSPTANRAFLPRVARVHRDDPSPTCWAHGRRDCKSCNGRNAWETRAPHMASIKPPDGECHHPLVKCHHKW